MKIKNILIFLVPLFMLAVFFLGLGNDKIYDTKNLVSKKISNFELFNFDKKKLISNQELSKNDYTLINLWASWCAPCRKEHKYLLSLKKNFNLKILGINFKDDRKNALKYLEELGNPYYFLAADKKGKTSILFGTYGIPESILINKELFIIRKYIGPLNEDNFKEIASIIQK